MNARRLLASTALVTGTALACTLLRPLEGISDGKRDAAPADAVPDVAPHCIDGIMNADESDVDCGGAECWGCLYDRRCRADADCATGRCNVLQCDCAPGFVAVDYPAAVPAAKYCVSSTEVTYAGYASFLAQCSDASCGAWQYASLAVGCGWNQDLAPSTSDPGCPPAANAIDAGLPAACVDWCDAYTYCAHRGLRLCGGVAGGTAQFDMPRATEWYNACSKLGERDYPYGLAFDPAACNGPEGGAPAPPATFPACVGPYPLLFDLSGNVAEWEDGCSSKDQTAECPARGGFYDSDEFGLTCLSLARLPKMTRAPWVGFRCCRG